MPPTPPQGPPNPYVQPPNPYPGQHPPRPGGQPYGVGAPGHPPMQRPAAKKSNRGCWLMFGGMIVVMLLIIAGANYAFYRATKDTPIGDIMWAVGEGAQALREAQKAPGTQAMRDAGCSQAMAIDFKRFSKIAERFDAGMPDTEEMTGTMVTCTLGFMKETSGAASCHHYAKVYLDGGGVPDRRFMLAVSKSGRNDAICAEQYLADGTHVPAGSGGPPAFDPQLSP